MAGKRLAHFLAALACCYAACCPVSRAGTQPAQVFENFGLIGTWSPDCSRPASAENPRVTWRRSRGDVVHIVSFDGRSAALRDIVGTARRVDDRTIMFTVVRGGKLALTVTVELADDHVWTVRSVGEDGQVYYDGAVELATGKPSVADERCMKLTS